MHPPSIAPARLQSFSFRLALPGLLAGALTLALAGAGCGSGGTFTVLPPVGGLSGTWVLSAAATSECDEEFEDQTLSLVEDGEGGLKGHLCFVDDEGRALIVLDLVVDGSSVSGTVLDCFTFAMDDTDCADGEGVTCLVLDIVGTLSGPTISGTWDIAAEEDDCGSGTFTLTLISSP